MLVVNGPGGAGRGEKRLSDSLCRLSVLTYSFEDSSVTRARIQLGLQ